MFQTLFTGLLGRMSRQTQPYMISARKYDTFPARLCIEAYSPAHALLTAQELFPEHVCSAVAVAPDWEDAA